MKIFTGNANVPLANSISKYLNIPLSKAIVSNFPDGETKVINDENVRGEDVFVIQSTFPNANQNWMELFILIDALKRASASRITAVIPYFGYARQDRKDRSGVPITSKLVSNLLVSAGANRVLTVDLHASQIQGFFDIPVDHLTASNVFINYIKYKKLDNIVIVSPDISGIKTADIYAKYFNCFISIIIKKRNGDNDVKCDTIIGNVKDKIAIIVDDIASTGGSIILATKMLKSNGVDKVFVCISHNLLNNESMTKLSEVGVDEFITTDSVSHVTQTSDLKTTTISIASMIGESIRCIHSNESVSPIIVNN